jgi:hypothetical protein
MFCNEMSSTWVQTASEETGHYKVYERSRTEGEVEEIVCGEDDEKVEDVPLSQSLNPNECGSEGVK